ncbi:GNAT family N-acetyltransferase [Pseudoalteromonas sp. KAN5]|uniref:GNAT family N-acetyltransferase n=1 Tax=Pseudoalteromonas sp. KAN5 TaxID=2916633 RepID=UPI001FCBA7CA|nr:GNAT family N-acetyltransferase [Pseudoalteromonas sp. KAN5]BDF94523.1 N-acetyltransferase [Pseudoalteromonas sp. KAN5]
MPNKSTPIIDTERLQLRPLDVSDAENLLAIFADPIVMEYWHTPPWQSHCDAIDFIASSQAASEQQKQVCLAMILKSTQQLIGKCMLHNYVPDSKRAEIGYALSPQYWGKGLVFEAAHALLSYGFKEIGLRRIEAELDPDNAASAKTLERLGFIKEGLLRKRWEINGVISDSALYGLLVGDLHQNNSKA